MPKNNPAELKQSQVQAVTRRHFFQHCQSGIGALALAQLAGNTGFGKENTASKDGDENPMAPKPTMHPTKVKNVIYLHMAGSPPQHETFDYKPELAKREMQDCPEEFFKGKTFAFIKGRPKLLAPRHKLNQHGKSGVRISETMPHLSTCADDLCIVNSMHTDQFNHAPAQLLLHTGNQQFGGASMGAWATYGLGSVNQDLPGYMVMVSGGVNPSGGKSLWGSSYLPSVYQGVQCRGTGDPILFVNNPAGMPRDVRRDSLDALNELNRQELDSFHDPETLTRIRQFELAYRMQTAVPEVMDISRESKKRLEAYQATPGKASFANNCLLACNLVKKGVRFVQLFDWGWDIHGTNKGNDLVHQFPKKCKQTDQPIAALLKNLKDDGLLDTTLVVWSGEFGRTPMNEARNGSKFFGRDHHPDCFSIWMAGGGVKTGTHGLTDELGYKVVEGGVSVRDFQATLLHMMGLDPHRFHFPYQGLDQRLIGPANAPKVQHQLIA